MKSLLTFIAGITIGAGVSWVYHKEKYERMVQEEVESLREHYKGKEGGNSKDSSGDGKMCEPTNIDSEEESISGSDSDTYQNIIDVSKYDTCTKSDITDKYKKPFVVTPDDFGSVQGFDFDTFYYHNNDIIANDDNEVLEDVEYVLGLTTEQIKEQFGVYENDSVYIRNMRLKTDYEILLDDSDYVKRNGD